MLFLYIYTHTHTHIYIYIYIYTFPLPIRDPFSGVPRRNLFCCLRYKTRAGRMTGPCHYELHPVNYRPDEQTLHYGQRRYILPPLLPSSVPHHLHHYFSSSSHFRPICLSHNGFSLQGVRTHFFSKLFHYVTLSADYISHNT